MKVPEIYTFGNAFPIPIGHRVELIFSDTHFEKFYLNSLRKCEIHLKNDIDCVWGDESCHCRSMEEP